MTSLPESRGILTMAVPQGISTDLILVAIKQCGGVNVVLDLSGAELQDENPTNHALPRILSEEAGLAIG